MITVRVRRTDRETEQGYDLLSTYVAQLDHVEKGGFVNVRQYPPTQPYVTAADAVAAAIQAFVEAAHGAVRVIISSGPTEVIPTPPGGWPEDAVWDPEG